MQKLTRLYNDNLHETKSLEYQLYSKNETLIQAKDRTKLESNELWANYFLNYPSL